MLEKRGVISDETPDCGEPEAHGEPGTKEAADRMEAHPANTLADAVADQTRKNK